MAKHTKILIALKGLQIHEDGYLAGQHAPQVKRIIPFNYGNRVMDTAPPSVHTSPEIRKFCPEILERLDVEVDGGIKRGTEVVEVPCLGVKAVRIGKVVLFGLDAYRN